jgi:predicted molibdopterin-dependent oxidoreductase YjgC
VSTSEGLSIRRKIELAIDGETVSVLEGTTILQACRDVGTEIPTLCYGDTITPKNACRVCMVEVEGSRVLVPSCSRTAEAGMVVRTDSDRARHSRRLVLELLGSSVDLSLTRNVERWNAEYGAVPTRFGPAAEPSTDRDEAVTGHHRSPTGSVAENVDQPVKVDNELYVRDYAKCIL